jgi:GAF domain-containing protein
MIFFFGAGYAYIIAESTRTLLLEDDSQNGLDDSLWFGFTKISRDFSVCEHTADLPCESNAGLSGRRNTHWLLCPMNEDSNAKEPFSTSIVHIVNNLTKDMRFCDRPYVKDGPRARFYAGVPITTPKSINVGALCVLDDKQRDGLQPSQVDFTTSMAHLDLVQQNR